VFSDEGGQSADIPRHVKHRFTNHREQPAGICNVYSSPDYPAGAKQKRTNEGAPRRVVDVWKNSAVRIGISGWTYRPWRGETFYPKGWPQKREFGICVATSQLDRNQRLFSVNGGRFITHFKRLKEVETPLANFFASGVLCLREKLGAILWQLPPRFVYDPVKLEAFFRLLPRTTSAAAALARNHDDRLDGRAWTKADRIRPLRHALEVRHISFIGRGVRRPTAKARHCTRCGRHRGQKWPFMEDATSDFVYVRLHGDEELYVSGYSDAALQGWERKIRAWARGDTPVDAQADGATPLKTSKPPRHLRLL
jgi:uncharacterized protein YecE (DUF72 family)